MNPQVMDTFKKRTLIIKAIREYLDSREYIEVDTPILSTIASGAAARPFVTKSNALNLQLYLRIATELYLKRCIVGGMERVYDMGKNFRNEGIDIRHNPEFTMIELYQAYADYNDMMELCENMMPYAAEKATGSRQGHVPGHRARLQPALAPAYHDRRGQGVRRHRLLRGQDRCRGAGNRQGKGP
jgi:lysyl-tRNA synthetase, class II